MQTELKILSLGMDEEPQGGVESELLRFKEQLEDAKNVIAHLSERVSTYRYRWLDEYYHADNLKRHMPCGIYMPDLDQIQEGIASLRSIQSSSPGTKKLHKGEMINRKEHHTW